MTTSLSAVCLTRSSRANKFVSMTKEEIYEKYWQKLVQIRRVYTGNRPDSDTLYIRYKQHAEKERDRLLKKYGYDPFLV